MEQFDADAFIQSQFPQPACLWRRQRIPMHIGHPRLLMAGHVRQGDSLIYGMGGVHIATKYQ
ncbi:hypothetical protein GCM10023219_13720 [Stakelama sediminis]